MLTSRTRDRYHTLHDAAVLQGGDDAPVFIFVATDQEPHVVTRRDFRHAVWRYAAGLKQRGIGPGDLVILAHTQNPESIFLFWAALHLGAIPSLFPTLTEKLDPDVYAESMATLVRLSGARAIFTTDAFAGPLQAWVDCPVYGSPAAADRHALAPQAPQQTDPASIAFLQHSSGTTGLQKGVALSHRAVLNQIAAYSDAIALHADDVVVSWLPLYHDMGLIAGFILPLIQGVPLVLMSPFDWVRHPALLLRAIDQYQGTLCWLPNFAYNHCARRIRRRDLEGLSLASMRLFVNCSEPVRHSSHRGFLERFAPYGVRAEMLGVSYAMAENTFAVTQTPPGAAATLMWVDEQALATAQRAVAVASGSERAVPQVSCGPPIAGTAVSVRDGDGTPLPEGRVGELAIRSDYMLSGYYRRPDLQPFVDGWYHTGDLGYLHDGEVYVVGRAKDLIISAGKNIFPQDIEAIVNEVPGVIPGRSVAFGIDDEREGTELIVVVAESAQRDEEARRALARTIRQTVSTHSMVTPAYVDVVPPRWILKTSSGKAARAANREKWLNGRP
jgi:acyl-CoA synthetase (AMP-forming)/AMP-acid ligase II